MTGQTFEALRAKRLNYVRSARENQFEEGLRTLLADLYPDNAHFIFELLQNAEDAKASTVYFDLQRTQLTVEHDGTRAFTLANVEAITSIGQSTKRDDETQIGKFGIGFKAVFAYTNRPEVRSGQFSFAIEDLFVPEPVDALPTAGKTTFVFPFDRPIEKPMEVAYSEIERGLLDLSETTVLFLNNIKTIRYTTAEGHTGSVARKRIGDRYVTIESQVGLETSVSHWLRLVGDHTLSEVIPLGQSVSAAFKLDRAPGSRSRTKGTTRTHVVPLETGQTCIYFPAENEKSGLRFHIHAPFASTVARDSVRNTEGNDQLAEAIGRLVAQALPQLRDDGLIDDGLLSALPNAGDALETRYAPIRKYIRQAFWDEEITPVYLTAEFASAEALVSGPAEFRSGLEIEDLPPLMKLAGREVKGDPPRWIAPREGRAGRFLAGLGVTVFDWDDLDNSLKNAKGSIRYELDEGRVVLVHAKPPAEWEEWLRTKSDEGIRAFYILLGRGIFENELDRSIVTNLRLIRARTGGDLLHCEGSEVFLPASRTELGDGHRVPLEIAFVDEDEAGKSSVLLEALFSAAGVREWNLRSQVQVRLADYSGGHPGGISDEQHLADMRMFITHLSEHPDDQELFVRAPFLKAEDFAGFVPPYRVCLDSPYRPTGLGELIGSGSAEFSPLSDFYLRHDVEGIDEFAARVQCVTNLTVSPADPMDNAEYLPRWLYGGGRTANGSRRDYDIPELPAVVASQNGDLLRLLWELVVRLGQPYERASFQLNSRTDLHPMPSQLFQRLLATEWILDRDGRLRNARSMSLDLLPEGWTLPSPTSFVMRLGFGEDARNRDDREVVERDVLSNLGASADLIDNLMRASKTERRAIFDEMDERLRQEQSFPQENSADPVRRAGMVGSTAGDAPEYRTEKRQQSVVPGWSEVKGRARQYLTERYTNDEGDMYCQLCQLILPFRRKDGTWHFEAVQLVRKRGRIHFENSIALCPLCAARYKYLRDTEDETIIVELEELVIDAETSAGTLPILLDQRRSNLRFTGKHLIDLKAVLAVAGESRIVAGE